MTFEHRLTTLDSGVRIVTENMPSVRSVSLGFWIGTGSRGNLFYGYLTAAVLMLAAAIVELVFGIAAERQSLEKIAEPLSAH